MEDEHEPILILAFDKEAERCVPITDEDVERGHLEPGWILIVEWSLIVVNRMGGVTIADPGVCSLGESWQLHRVTTGGIGIWTYYTLPYYFPANKMRLSEDEVFFTPMRVADLQPGMVFRMPRGRFYVCLSDAQHARVLGDGEMSPHPDEMTENDSVCSVCCTRPPSMQFIFK